jgi:hypothetical protein
MRVEEPGGPDALSMSLDHPVYQVTIFERLAEPAEVPEEQRGYHLHEWKVSEAEAGEVLAWAAAKAAGQEYTVEVASLEIDGESHLLRLHGHNPNRVGPPSEPYVLAPDVIPNMRDFRRGTRGGQ